MDKKHDITEDTKKLQETEADGNRRAIDLTFEDVLRLQANPSFLLLLPPSSSAPSSPGWA